MSIKNIKNPLIRKLLIIFAAPFFIPLALILLALENIVANALEIIEFFASAWKGKTHDQ